jgi:uncharacterized RDD family membrane protein YckC
MKAEEIYIGQVLSRVPPGELRARIAMDLQSHIADHLEHGHSVEEAIRQLGDPEALAESYLSAVPLAAAPHLRRAAAKLVDLFPPIGFAAGMAAMYALGFFPSATRSLFLSALLAATVIVVVGAYCVYLMLAEWRTGQTPGKRLFGLRVVRESGARIGLGQAFVRQLPSFLQIVLIDALFALFTDRRQRAFELLTKTRVVVAEETPHAERVAQAVP